MNRPERLVLSVLALGLVLPPAAAQNYKLNGPLAQDADVDIFSFAPTADGRVVVFTARADEEAAELYAASLEGGPGLIRLNRDLPENASIGGFDVAGSTHVVYRADDAGGSGRSLISVPVNRRTEPIELSHDLKGGASVSTFEIGPDETHVYYLADRDAAGDEDLFRVPADGSAAPVKLNADLPPGADVSRWLFDPAGTRLVYVQEAVGRSDVFSVRVDGSDLVLLSGTIGGWGATTAYMCPAGGVVAFVGRGDTDPDADLYVVPIDGSSEPLRLSAGPGSGSLLSGDDDVQFTPDGTTTVFRSDPTTKKEIFSVPVDGSAPPILLSGDPPQRQVREFVVSPTGDEVLYIKNTPFEVFSTPVDGSSGPRSLYIHEDKLGRVGGPRFSPDGTRALFVSDDKENEAFELYSMPVTGGERVTVAAVGGGGGGVHNFSFLGQTGDLLFWGDSVQRGSVDLRRAPFDGSSEPELIVRGGGATAGFTLVETGSTTQVVWEDVGQLCGSHGLMRAPFDGLGPSEAIQKPEAELTRVGRVWALDVSPVGDVALYFAEQHRCQELDLFQASALRPGRNERVNSPLAPEGSVLDAAFTSDGQHVVYRADQEGLDVHTLYSVPLDGSEPPVRISDIAGIVVQEVERYRITPDDTRVVFTNSIPAFPTLPRIQESLFSAPIDGSSPRVRLSKKFVNNDDTIADYVVSPDSRWVVYREDPFGSADGILYSVPVDGSLPEIRLGNGASDVQEGYGITLDSARVAYRSDERIDRKYELFSVPIEGGTRLRLSGNLGDGDVLEARFAPDGTIVFLANPDAGPQRLYRVLAHKAGRTELTRDFVPDGNAVEFAMHGERVVYRADQEVDELFGVYVAPLDGSTDPVKVSGDWNVEGLLLSPDGSRVVFLTSLGEELMALVSAPTDGSEPPTLLAAAKEEDQEFETIAISPDSRLVAYIGDLETVWTDELFGVPIAGGQPPRRLNGPLVEGGIVFDDSFTTLRGGIDFTPGGERILYLATQEEVVVIEAFATVIRPTLGSLAARRGPATGGNTVVLNGLGFTEHTSVLFGDVAAPSVTLASPSRLRAVVPSKADAAGHAVSVTVTDAGARSTLPAAYTYDHPARR